MPNFTVTLLTETETEHEAANVQAAVSLARAASPVDARAIRATVHMTDRDPLTSAAVSQSFDETDAAGGSLKIRTTTSRPVDDGIEVVFLDGNAIAGSMIVTGGANLPLLLPAFQTCWRKGFLPL